MSDMEQVMLHDPKHGLDGKFFFLTSDGRVECKEVDSGHSPVEGFKNNYSKEYMRKGGRTAGPSKRNHVVWTDGQLAWLRKNMEIKTPRQCAKALNVPYHRVYFKINDLRIKDFEGAK